MASPNPSTPVTQSQTQTPNLNPSPFQQPLGQSTPSQRAQNPQSPITGQNTPNYGGGGLSQLIQSQTVLIQAIQQLTKAVGGSGGAGGNAAPSHAKQGVGGLIAQIATNPNTFGGLAPGMGYGGMVGQMALNKLGSYMSPGAKTFAQAGMNSLGTMIGTGINAGAMALNIGGGISGASSAQGLFGGLSGVPVVGGLLASLGAGFGVAQGRFADMNQYEKVATMTSIQMNRKGREELDLIGLTQGGMGMNRMANEFRPLGIGPTEGAGLLGQMMLSSGALNAGAHMMTLDPLAPSSMLGRQLSLPEMMRQGYSAGTVGFAQRLTPEIFGNRFMGSPGGTSAAQTAYGVGRAMNFNDIMQNEFNQQTYGLLNTFALNGGNPINVQNFLRGGIGGMTAAGVGNDIAMQALIQRETKAGNLGEIQSPFAGLANNRLRFKFLQQANFDPMLAQELQQSATSYDKFKMIADDVGVQQAQREMQGAGFNAMELKSFAAQYSGAKAEITGLELYNQQYAGNEVAQTGAELESDAVQNRRGLIMNAARLNREIENSQLKFLNEHFGELSDTVRQLNAMQLILLQSTAEVVKEFTNLAKEMKKDGVMTTITNRLNPLRATPKTPQQIQQDQEKTKQINNAYDADSPVGGP